MNAVTTTKTFYRNRNLTGVNETGTLTTMVCDTENRLKKRKQKASAKYNCRVGFPS